jgi:hypothetical protein
MHFGAHIDYVLSSSVCHFGDWFEFSKRNLTVFPNSMILLSNTMLTKLSPNMLISYQNTSLYATMKRLSSRLLTVGYRNNIDDKENSLSATSLNESTYDI